MNVQTRSWQSEISNEVSIFLASLFMGFTSPPRKMISPIEVLENGSNQDLKN
jgi:hypothetical protein